ncbi:NF-X1 finger transcription factor [Aspergillus sclerotialis]|uniref:NF-X1 finger transcription factor n=1 Tax=Aspergillus sclerotialis TaxID=2070753 RepID=A0A3A2ZM82_9EURO|nr:NF-X1 finger transcription factor [Aspergillus sclerotialis]
MQVLPAPQNPVQATGVMSGPTASPTRPNTSRRSGRGRGNRGPPRRNQAQSASNVQPSRQETQQEQSLGPSASKNTNDAPRQPRGPKRGRRGEHRSDGGRARRQPRNNEREIPGRAFQGRLTRPDQPSEGVSPSKEHAEDLTLRADAPEFVPGVQPARDQYADTRSSTAPNDSKTKSKAKTSQSRPKVTTKSTAPDISSRIHEDITNNLYECPICTGELGRKSRVWSCGLCWTVFHLSCVKKWSKNEGSAAQDAARRQHQDVDSVTNSTRAWRCPGKLTRARYLAFLRILVAKPAHDHGRDARIHVTRFAMLGHVRHVQPWDRRKIASVVETPPPNVVETRTTSMGGAVVKHVAICCLAVSILALGRVTKVFVVPAR